MTAGRRQVLVAALLSGLAHAALAPAALLVSRAERPRPEELEIDIDVEPEPTPHLDEPPLEQATPAPADDQPPPDKKPARRAARSQTAVETDDATAGDDPDAVGLAPRFSVSMQSSSGGPGEVAAAAGPGHQGTPGAPPAAGRSRPAAQPVEGAAASRLPLPLGRCSGTYTEEARRAGVEGTVILDLVVDVNGRARDIHVERGLDHGLTGAAIAALRRCRFTAGERDGAPVPVRLRAFKIRFLLREND